VTAKTCTTRIEVGVGACCAKRTKRSAIANQTKVRRCHAKRKVLLARKVLPKRGGLQLSAQVLLESGRLEKSFSCSEKKNFCSIEKFVQEKKIVKARFLGWSPKGASLWLCQREI
jgi:hypothetical protein